MEIEREVGKGGGGGGYTNTHAISSHIYCDNAREKWHNAAFHALKHNSPHVYISTLGQFAICSQQTVGKSNFHKSVFCVKCQK